MGNTDSRKTFKHGSVSVTLDNQHLMTGEVVKGEVSYKLTQAYPGEHLIVEFIGKEKVIYEGSDKKNHDPKHSGKIVIKKELIRLTNKLQIFDKLKVEPGQAQFPFEFKIPQELPSSLFFLGHKEGKISITYKIVARIDEPVINGKQQFKPLIAKRVMILSQPLSKVNFNVSMKQENNIKTLLLFNAGKSKVDVTLDKDAYTTKETINLNLNFDNKECDTDVKSAKVRLIREINSVSAGGVEYSDKTILMKRKCEGVHAKTTQQRIFQIPLDIIDFKRDSLLKDFRKKRQFFCEEMNEWLYTLQPSTNGSYFTCKYYAKITFRHSAATLGQKLGEIFVPIQIYFISSTFAGMPKYIPPADEEMDQPQSQSLAEKQATKEEILPPNPYLNHMMQQTNAHQQPIQQQQQLPQQQYQYSYQAYGGQQNLAFGQPVVGNNGYNFQASQTVSNNSGGSLYPSLDLPPLTQYNYQPYSYGGQQQHQPSQVQHQPQQLTQTLPAYNFSYQYDEPAKQQQMQPANH
ncbi:UNKNOWN [Stylonychia lemnae]|uniref:Arrestin-like N-terminal domain-containing protein n=1 Tax=Stylonychia lemnae TaxID=5949 RepID=A0A077ZZL7_STYLE|nr:UNKNOWN [Stylonychia lemnae]|eukprot:CDW75052.1 UNKNOWN [Stylonychia lemnae]